MKQRLIDWRLTKKFLHGALAAYEINSTPETPSTQTLAKEAARNGAPHGSVFVTDFQNSGRGRRDRSWQSLPGKDLTFSLVMRPPAAVKDAPLFSLAAALAVSRAVGKILRTAERVSIKWPNDVMIGEKKVCGIICDCAGAERLDYVVIGIGINVNRAEDELAVDTLNPGPAETANGQSAPRKSPPTSLLAESGRTFSLPELLVSVLGELEEAAGLLATGEGRAQTLGSYRKACSAIGRAVTIFTDDGKFEGIAAGISDEGAIMLDTSRGERMAFNAGDVVHARLKG
jgi:BirA family biotin operon repressor/biotin-[acetyl-CoA-carboxylase] ligase